MPKLKMDYSKFSSDRKHVERTQHTEKRQSEQGFFESLSGEAVQVHLMTGKEIAGVLSASTYNRYDIMLENSEGQYLVPKAAILYVKYCKGGDRK